MTRHFPLLGFDPAPGDPDAIAGAARRLRLVADELGTQAGALQRAGGLTSSWQGSAACAYTGRASACVAGLRTAAEVLGGVSSRLLWWSGQLRDLQEMAQRLERAAVPASAAACLPGPATELESLRARARRLQERAEHSARVVAVEVRAAVEASPAARRFDGWTDAPFGVPVGRWVVEHQDTLDGVANASGDAGLVVTAAGLVAAPWAAPVVAAAGTGIGAALGGVGLLAHAATAHYGDGSWSAVGLDVLGLTVAGVGVHAVRRQLPDLARASGRLGHGISAWSVPDFARRRLGIGTGAAAPSAASSPLGRPQTPQARRIAATWQAAARSALDDLLVAPLR